MKYKAQKLAREVSPFDDVVLCERNAQEVPVANYSATLKVGSHHAVELLSSHHCSSRHRPLSMVHTVHNQGQAWQAGRITSKAGDGTVVPVDLPVAELLLHMSSPELRLPHQRCLVGAEPLHYGLVFQARRAGGLASSLSDAQVAKGFLPHLRY